jgi:hypothetical protein
MATLFSATSLICATASGLLALSLLLLRRARS